MPKRKPVGQRSLHGDCYILLVSLVLTEPKTTRRQQRLITKLIKRLRAELERDGTLDALTSTVVKDG